MSDGDNKMLRGHINIIILKALLEGEKYGYEIGKYIEQKSGGDYKIKQPTLYSALKRLEDRKIIESYWGDESETQGGRRKYFKLTEYGRQICDNNVENWNKSKGVIDKLINKEPRQIFNGAAADDNSTGRQVYSRQKQEILPRQPRVLYYEQTNNNEKDFEYRKILDKLLSNVKKDEKTENVHEIKTPPPQSPASAPEILQDKDLTQSKADLADEFNAWQKAPASDGFSVQGAQEYAAQDISGQKYSQEIRENDFYREKDFGGEYSLLPSREFVYEGLNKLQGDLERQGFYLKPYTDLRKQTRQYLLINKINMFAALILYLFIALQTTLIYFFCEPLINIGAEYYLYALAAIFLFPLFSLLTYAVKPRGKTKQVFYVRNLIIGSLMLFMLAVLCIVGIAMLFDINTGSTYEILIKLVIPISYAFNFVTYWIIWGILYRTKTCFSN